MQRSATPLKSFRTDMTSSGDIYSGMSCDLDNPFFVPATPLSIPFRNPPQKTINMANDNISTLLQQTKIPRKFSKTRRKPAGCATTTNTPIHSPENSLQQPNIFGPDDTPASQSLPASYCYLLTPPETLPDLSRSCSTNSLDSDISITSSPSAKASRLHSPPRQEIDLNVEDPLAIPELAEDLDLLESSPSATPARRRSSLTRLLIPLKAVAPTFSAASLVSTFSANLSSWAISLASSQYDDGYGLLPSIDGHCPRGGMVHTALPRRSIANRRFPLPIKASGPKPAHSTIIEAEMERAPLADVSTEPAPVELVPWKTNTKRESNAAAASTSLQLKCREPRLNSDFLRVLVLETNMRRLGKIAPGPGRARMILSPRFKDHGTSHLREMLTI